MKKQAILISLLALTMLNCKGIRRDYHWFMDMAYSPAIDSQRNDPMDRVEIQGLDKPRVGNRLPPENTVPYKFLNPIYNTDAPGIYVIDGTMLYYRYNGIDYDGGSSNEDLAPLLAVLKSPWKSKDEAIERGEQRFKIYCAPCHGADGKAVTPVNDVWQGIPALRAEEAGEDEWISPRDIEKWSEARYFMAITVGVGAMPPYASQIPERDRWAIAAYLKKLQRDARK
ncbi:MAG: cytochrome c [Leptospirales bacterium]